MKEPPRIFDILAACPDPAAHYALAAGLPLVDADTQCQIIDILVARGAGRGLECLPDYFDRLAPEAQDRLVVHTGHLFAVFRVTIRSPVLQTRLNTLALIRRSLNPRLAYLAAAAIRDGSHHVRAEAAATLRDLAELHCERFAETTALLREAGEDGVRIPVVQTLRLLRDEHQHLVAAIRETLEHFESHHRPEILESAMFLADELEGSLFKHSASLRSKLVPAMLEAFTSSPSPRMAPFAYIALGYPELRRRVVHILSRLRNTEFFAACIHYHWLARDPAIRRNLSALRNLTWLSDAIEAAFALPPRIAALAPSWILSLGLPSEQKVKLLANFLLLDNPDANRAAIWALTTLRTPAADLGLRGACDHDDSTIRRVAQLELRHRQRTHRARRSPRIADRPAEWSELLDQAGIGEDFQSLWTHFDRIPTELAASAGHHVLQFVPSFQTEIQIKLIAQHPSDRLRALRLLNELHLIRRFAREIFASANDPAAEVRAAAMRALGDLADPTSRRILERALGDAAPSVQSAAIEALDQIAAPKRAALFLPKAGSADANVRAAAVQALLKMHEPKAAHSLLAMLKDDRSDHRCSALWIVEQLRLTAIAPRIEDMAERDPDPRIARIAQQIRRRLHRTFANDSELIAAPVAIVTEEEFVSKGGKS